MRKRLMSNDKTDKVAFALFARMYEGDVDDDPDFTRRLWESLNDRQRRPWTRQADTAIAVISSDEDRTPNLRQALLIIRDMQIAEQDNIISANMRTVARNTLARLQS
jgi:hypothetical protein